MVDKDAGPEWRGKEYYWKKKIFKQKAKIITIDVLDTLLGLPEALASGFERKSVYRAINDCYDKELSVEKICGFFNNMKRHGYLEVEKHLDGQESIRFTSKAKIKVIDKIAESSKWDGRYRLISFDIPENMRANRDKFRRAIKRIGFHQIQKSLWVCNRNVGDLIELVAYEYGVAEYIVYIVADKTDIDGMIEKMFAANS